MRNREANRISDLDRAVWHFLKVWDADGWLKLNASGSVRDAVARLNDLQSKPDSASTTQTGE